MIAPTSTGGHAAMVLVSRTIMLRLGVNSPLDRLPSCGMRIHPSAAGVTAICVGELVPFTTTELTSRIAPTSFSDEPIIVGRIWFGRTGVHGPGDIALGCVLTSNRYSSGRPPSVVPIGPLSRSPLKKARLSLTVRPDPPGPLFTSTS